MKTFQLAAGDVMLFKPADLAGWLITVKTWHLVSHCSAYVGQRMVISSDVPYGTRYYPLATKRKLFKVLRPKEPLDLDAGLRWFNNYPKQPYGWLDLAAYVALPWDGPGETCSAIVTMFLRACGLDPFDGEDARLIAPFEFDLSSCFTDHPIDAETEVLP